METRTADDTKPAAARASASAPRSVQHGPTKRKSVRKKLKPPPLFREDPALMSSGSDFTTTYPTGSSASSVVGPLVTDLGGASSGAPGGFDQSTNSNTSTASAMTSTSSTSSSSSSRSRRWWKRMTSLKPKRLRPADDVCERDSLDQELYVRSILESYASSMSSNRYSSSTNPNAAFADGASSGSSHDSVKRSMKGESVKSAALAARQEPGQLVSTADSSMYMAQLETPNGYENGGEHLVDMDSHHLTAGVPGLHASARRDDDPERQSFARDSSSMSEDEDRNQRRLQRRIKIEAMRAKLLEKNQHRARARKKMGIFVACIAVTLTAFVVAAVLIARVGVDIQNNTIQTVLNSTSTDNSSSSSSGSIGMEATGSSVSASSSSQEATSAAFSGSGLTTDSLEDDSGSDATVTTASTDIYTYVHCVLMVLSLWMSLVVVIMHLTFRSFRTYSHPFVLELSCVQCGYWITALLRVVFETSSLSDMAYLFFCMFECFFNFAQISFTCAIAFNMYRSVVSYADVLLDSQSAKQRYRSYTVNVLLLSLLAAVTLALVGYRSGDSDEDEDYSSSASSSAETEEEILDSETFSPCLYPTCRVILYVYYPLLAFAFNFIFYMRFKRTIGESYPTSATGRLNQVMRSYLLVFFVCWGSLIILTAFKVADATTLPSGASFVMQSIFDVLGVGTSVITFTNFHRCRKAFDFGLSLKAIDPNSIEFDDPVNIVGEGTFAIVLKARWRQGGSMDNSIARSIEVAVKTFKHAQIDCLDHIKEEAYLSSKLVHPCVMMTYGCYTSGINLYIVYEYLGGGTLQDVIDANMDSPLPYERVLRYAHMIAVGMRFLHGLPVPIVHRDLKPLNCIFDSEQEMLKVADFGESRLLRTRDVVASRPNFYPSADLTLQMTTNIGSACWAAPEVLKDEATSEYSVKIDVYSFGIICWQLYTCSVPYTDIPGSVLAVAEAVLSGVRPPIPADCPNLFAKIMKRCWHDNPLRRPSFEDIVQLLEIELAKERKRQRERANVPMLAPPTLGENHFDDSRHRTRSSSGDSDNDVDGARW